MLTGMAFLLWGTAANSSASEADRATYTPGVKLETERLILREFVLDDAVGLAACRQGERFWRYYEVEDDIAGRAAEHVAMFVSWQGEVPRTHYQLAVVLKETGSLIGSCGIRQTTAGALRSQQPVRGGHRL